MSRFLEQVQTDNEKVFIDFAAFGEEHTMQGQKVLIVPDEDALRRRTDKSGLDFGTFMFYVREKDLDFVPQPDANLNFDGKHAVITECNSNMGIYTITLRQVR